MTGIVDKFWLDDPYILLRSDRFLEFYITPDMSDSEKLNSIMRFTLYLGIILSFYKQSPRFLLVIALSALVTWFIYHFGIKKSVCKENLSSSNLPVDDIKKFRTPTLNNPLMNTSVVDFTSPKSRKKAISYNEGDKKSQSVKKEIDDKFSYNLYENFSDIYGTMNSKRQFYTMPSEFTAHDSNGEFKEFLYGGLKSAKEDSYTNIRNVHEPLNFRSRS